MCSVLGIADMKQKQQWLHPLIQYMMLVATVLLSLKAAGQAQWGQEEGAKQQARLSWPLGLAQAAASCLM
jgi:hypothetical protein